MRMTSGSWRSTCLSALAKLCVSWPTSRWLTSDRWLRVQELDRVLDRHDVVGARAVDEVDERGERRRLAGTGRAGDEHETARQLRELRRRPSGTPSVSSFLISVGMRRNAATDRAALLVEVHAEAGVRREREREVELEVLVELLLLLGVRML